MKVIKQGKTKEELKAILNATKRFECKTCGCIFEADKGEYKSEDVQRYTYYYCECPNCSMNASEVKMR
jgi:rubredoxin